MATETKPAPSAASTLLEFDPSDQKNQRQRLKGYSAPAPTKLSSRRPLKLITFTCGFVIALIVVVALITFSVLFVKSGEGQAQLFASLTSGCEPPPTTTLDPVFQSRPKYMFSTVELSWFDALTRCRSYGLELVSIESQEEQDVILTYLAKIGEIGSENSWWTSGNSLNSSADGNHHPALSWRWAGRNKPIHKFTFWHHREPDASPKTTQKCLELTPITGSAVILTHGQIRWNAWICRNKVKFICEAPDRRPDDGYVRV